MIDGNILKFGYGDIAVGSNWYYLKFQQFKPPANCGDSIDMENYETIGDKITFICDYNELCNLSKLLDDVEKGEHHRTFEFNGYIFDFTNYNSKSLHVCKKHVHSVMKNHILLMAC